MKAAEIISLVTQPFRHGHHHDLRGVRCDGHLDLSCRDIAGVDFTDAVFPDGLNANHTRFHGLCWFAGAQFAKKTAFTSAQFMSDARFEKTHWDNLSEFAEAEFRGIARFDAARFPLGADFTSIVSFGNFSLQSARFAAPTSFSGAEWLGGLWCDNVHLPADTDWNGTQVHGRLWLRGALQGNAQLTQGMVDTVFGYAYE